MKVTGILLLVFLATPSKAFQGVDCTRNLRPSKSDLSAIALPTSIPQRSPDKRRAVQAVNFIDEILFAAQDQAGLPRAVICDDLTFLRRVTLDLTGRLPELERTLSFLEDTAGDKRDVYIEELLNSEAFVERWAYWFGELFQNSSFVGGARGAHKLADYLRNALRQGTSLEQLVKDLMVARGSTYYEGAPLYLLRQGGLGVSAADRVENEISAISAQWLGIDTNCISCHDGGILAETNRYLSKKKRSDLWAFAAFMITKRIEVKDGNVEAYGFNVNDAPERVYWAISEPGAGERPPRNGGQTDPQYLFSGEEPTEGEPTHEALARMIVADAQFSRNLANRFWAHFMTQGLVEPLDAFDLDRLDLDNLEAGQTLQPTQPALLKALAAHLRESHYDMRSFFRTLTRSATYQLSAEYPVAWEASYAAYHPKRLVRRLTGEEILDQMISSNKIIDSYFNYAGRATYFDENGNIVNRLFEYVHQLTDVSERAASYNYLSFLEAFGVGNRYDILRSDNLSPTQALLMMNHPLVTERLESGVRGFQRVEENGTVTFTPLFTRLGQIAKMPVSDREKVRLLFLNTLVREPDEEEMRLALRSLGKRNFGKGAGDLQWTLFNYDELRLGY